MPHSKNIGPSADFDIIVVGAGAAGLAAGQRLAASGLNFRILEARDRVGGRAFAARDEYPMDLGCGWLHSGDVNPLTRVLAKLGFTIDRTPPAWGRHSLDLGFSSKEQRAFGEAIGRFHQKIEDEALKMPDVPASHFLEEGNRFNPLIAAVTTYISGAEPSRISSHDIANYEDDGVNWRIVESYGAGIAALGRDLPITLACPVTKIDHSGAVLRLSTAQGEMTAGQVIVTLPTNLLAEEALAFTPKLPDKIAAAAVLPLGLADKVILALDRPVNLPKDGHLFGRLDRTDTASYHLRPFGRNLIEAYFGGHLAADLERDGANAFYAFAEDELADLLGSSIRARLRCVAETSWGKEPFSRGSYSYAVPGHADARQKLAEPVEGRIFFAGEACSREYFSTAHGAYLTGIAAAESALKATPR